jgi:hypothetical protein
VSRGEKGCIEDEVEDDPLVKVGSLFNKNKNQTGSQKS